MARLIPETIRHYLEDRDPQDNELEGDLMFSDEEIVKAMEHCAREFNGMPPLIFGVSHDCMDDSTMVFIDGTIKHLLIARRSRLMRNEVEHRVGGVDTSVDRKRIEYMSSLIKEHDMAFRQAAADWKGTVNLQAGYGPVG